MKVKEKLKIMDIKLSDFAKTLEISRPTLNSYISLYENGKEVPNEKYRIIFDNLFSDGVTSKEEFFEIMKDFQRLIERDKVLGTLDLAVDKTDLLSSIISHMTEDLGRNDYSDDIYKFINILVRSYRAEKTFVDFARYFLLLNSVIDISEMKDDEKAFISNCYSLMDNHIKSKLSLNQEYMDRFLSRVNDVKKQNEENTKNLAETIIKEKLMAKLNKTIKNKMALGLKIEEIDISDVLKNIDFQEEQENE